MDVKLSVDEFEHLCSNPPGTCGCNLCLEYWKKVNEFINEYCEGKKE